MTTTSDPTAVDQAAQMQAMMAQMQAMMAQMQAAQAAVADAEARAAAAEARAASATATAAPKREYDLAFNSVGGVFYRDQSLKGWSSKKSKTYTASINLDASVAYALFGGPDAEKHQTRLREFVLANLEPDPNRSGLVRQKSAAAVTTATDEPAPAPKAKGGRRTL